LGERPGDDEVGFAKTEVRLLNKLMQLKAITKNSFNDCEFDFISIFPDKCKLASIGSGVKKIFS
jgi:hypothetical protein